MVVTLTLTPASGNYGVVHFTYSMVWSSFLNPEKGQKESQKENLQNLLTLLNKKRSNMQKGIWKSKDAPSHKKIAWFVSPFHNASTL